MSYSIIFDTKFIELKDGRLLHLSRNGCNNDTAGRKLSEYRGKIYNKEELEKYAQSFMKDGKSSDFDLKIGSRICCFYDYGEHLLRMSKRAKTYEEICKERNFTASRFDGVNLYKPEEKFLTPQEFDKVFYEYLYSDKGFSYSRRTTLLNNEEEIVKTLENNQHIDFYVGKKYKK